MAMADIARQTDGGAVPLSQVAERQHLPLAYLEQLFVQLRRAGLVESARGRSGGYRLARPSDSVSISQVMSAVEEETRFTRCSGEETRCHGGKPCITHDLWSALSEVTSRFLTAVSLADLVAGGREALRAAGAEATKKITARHDGAARTYLDYNATAPLRDSARLAMVEALDAVGNPSSVHAEGRRARAIVEGARESVARLVGAKPSEVVFTSGASEANAWVLAQPWNTVMTTGIEHDSVLAAARGGSAELVAVAVAPDGVVRAEVFAEHILSGRVAMPALIALQMANNETGVIQPLQEVARFARAHGVAVHSDAVQAAGRIPIDFAALGLDTMAISSHKLGGPKGVGALVVRDHLDLTPLLRGGGQERRRRAGTENVPAIAGFGAAAEAALQELDAIARLACLRDLLESELKRMTPAAVIAGDTAPRLWNTTSLALPGKLAETLVIRLDLEGVAVSAGSACSSGKVGASHVLEAMGLSREIAAGTIRISLGPQTTREDIGRFLAAWKTIAGEPALAA